MMTQERACLPPLSAGLEAIAVTSSSPDYRLLRSSYMKKGSPALVLRVRDENDVIASIEYAAEARRQTEAPPALSIRSGGHGIAGTSTNDGGIVIDLRMLNRIDVVDSSSGIVRAQAGAIWGDVAEALTPHDLLLTSGNFGDTGVGGLATAGGVGYFARSQGLTIDRVRAVRLLTSDGRARWVDETHEADLFWAVRGGGARAGIALDFVFEAADAESAAGHSTVIEQEVTYVVNDVPAFMDRWGNWIRSAPRRAESFLMMQGTEDGRTVVRARNVWAGDDHAAARPTLEAAVGLGPVHTGETRARPYRDVVPTPRSAHVGQQRIVMRNVLVDRADALLGSAVAESLAHPVTLVAEVRALGGALADVPADATAWGHRHQDVLAATWAQPATVPEVDQSFAPLLSLGTGESEAYSSDRRPAAVERAFPGAAGRRLRAIAAAADPEGLFARP